MDSLWKEHLKLEFLLLESSLVSETTLWKREAFIIHLDVLPYFTRLLDTLKDTLVMNMKFLHYNTA